MPTSQVLAVGSFVLFVVALTSALYRPNDALSLARFSQWTNAVFVWPALRAAALGAYSETVVFALTLIVSVLHHGCLHDAAMRSALAAESFTLLGTTLIVIIVGTAVLATHSRPRYRGYAGVAALALSVLVATTVLGQAIFLVRRGRLDGCGYLHEPNDGQYLALQAPSLVRVWSSVDFVTAFAALIVVFVYMFQTHVSVELGVFWLFVVVVLAGTLLDHAQLMTDGILFAVLIVLAAAIIGGRLVLWCCIDDARHVAAAMRRYSAGDVVGGLLLAGAAVAIFIGHNEPAFHGWWHVLAAAALYLVVESVYAPKKQKEALL